MTEPSSLTILEEFLLLALDDSAGQFYTLPRSTFDCAVAGAVLMDLALHHRIDNDLRDMFVTDPTSIGNPILDPVLQLMALSPVLKPKPIHYWLRDISGQSEPLREKALRQLEARNILTQKDAKILWVFGARRYPLVHQKEQREVKLRLFGVILRDGIPEPRDIMLVALAHACNLFSHILSDREVAAASARIEQVARMDLIGQAVATAITEIESVIAMASGFR